VDPPSPPAPTPRGLDESRLQRLSGRELDLVFRSSPAGPLPEGRLRGTALLFPGTPLCGPLATLVRVLAWQGKETESRATLGRAALENLVGPLGFHAVRALLSHARSWVDGGQCVLIDYSTTSVVAAMVRDEIRLIAPGLYLGVTWVHGRRMGWFTLRQAAPDLERSS
jgi:hypothetical protein